MSKEEHIPFKVINEPTIKDSNSGSKIKVLMSMREIIERTPAKRDKPIPSPSTAKEEVVIPVPSIQINNFKNSTTVRPKLANSNKTSKDQSKIIKYSLKNLKHSALGTSSRKPTMDNSKIKSISSTFKEDMSNFPVDADSSFPVNTETPLQSTENVKIPSKEDPEVDSSVQEFKVVKYTKKTKFKNLKKKRHANDSEDVQTQVIRKKSGFRILDFAIVFTLLVLLGTTIYLYLCTFGIVCGNKNASTGATGCANPPPKIASNGKLVEPSTKREATRDSYEAYSSLMYVCDDKYVMTPDRDVTVCKEDGTWTHTQAPQCNLDYLNCQQKPGRNPPMPYGEEIVDEVDISCDYTNGGGGWIMILKRSNGVIDFERTFAEYENLVGSIETDHWLGLKNIHKLTSKKNYELRVDLWDFDDGHRFALYSSFSIGPGPDYKLAVSGYSGNAGDSLSVSNDQAFSAKDMDKDAAPSVNCAEIFKGGWWHEACHESNLLGKYLAGPHKSYADGVNWLGWRGYQYSLMRAEMKIRPK